MSMKPISLQGDPGGLESIAGRLIFAATDVATVRDRVARNDLEGVWTGEASESFRASLHPLPGHLGHVAAAFDSAGRAVRLFAAALADLQHEAAAYNNQLANYQHEIATATARASAEQTRLAEAHLKHSLASDPVSIATTRATVDLGESLVRQALAHVENVEGQSSRLAQWEARITSEYEQAVTRCCTGLAAAHFGGMTPFGAWLAGRIDEMGVVAGPLGALLAMLAMDPWSGGREDSEASQTAGLATMIGPFGLVALRSGVTGLRRSSSAQALLDDQGLSLAADASFLLGFERAVGVRLSDGAFGAEFGALAWGGVRGSAGARFALNTDGLDASAEAEYESGVGASLHDRMGFSDFYSEDTASVFVGQTARAGVSAKISPTGEATASAEAGAFDGAEASVSRTVDVGGVGAHAKAGVTAGVGASAGAKGSFGLDDIGFHGHAKVSLGLGVSGEVGMDIHPKQIAKAADGAYHDADRAWQGADRDLHKLW